MQKARFMHGLIEKALAFAHAAIDETTPHRVAEAKAFAEEIVPRIERIRPQALPLGEARQLFTRLGELRAALVVLDRKLALRLRQTMN